MDKRTLIFVISLSLTLFFVNFFFDKLNQTSLKQSHEKVTALKIQKRDQLKSEIQEHTAKLNELPLISLYSDSAQTSFLTSAIQSNTSLLTLPWTAELPETVYANGEQFQLLYHSDRQAGPVVYGKEPQDPLRIGNLPYLGTYELQLVTLCPDEADPAGFVTLGKAVDGQLELPIFSLLKYNKELDQLKSSEEYRLPKNAIVLFKTGNTYLPVGTYHAATKEFLLLEQLADLPTQIGRSKEPAVAITAQEQFFVLEDEFQQLVFSNQGGSLVEINLPFHTPENPKSVVKEIDFDREILADHPENARFPLRPYYTPGNHPTGPHEKHTKGHLGGYYPLIRRDLLKVGTRGTMQVPPEFYALNIVSKYPELAELTYEVKSFDQKKIVFEAVQRNRKIQKIYTLGKAPYCLDLLVKVEGEGKGLWLTSGVPEVEIISNSPAPVMKYRITRKGKAETIIVDKPSESVTVSNIYPDWICNSNGFLGLILDPLSSIGAGYRAQYVPGTLVPSRLILIDAKYDRFKPQNLPGYMVLLPLEPKGGRMHFRIFAGPFASETLKTVDKIYTDSDTGKGPDYIASKSFHGWFSFISAPISKLLLVIMNFFHALTGSWALSIVLLTIALRLMLYPLNTWSTKSMLKMQQIAPQVQKIQEKYKKEPQKAQIHVMNLYRESGVNPLSGCFPILIQLPFLIGMFDLLKSTFELRGATFIPGWIDNLAAPDVLFSWTTPVFFFGTQFHLLPFLLGAVMFLNQRVMSTQPKDPSKMTEQQRQQKIMGMIMPAVFTVMFYHFPSGLNIYWLSSTLVGMLQQWWIQKRFQNQKIQPTVEIFPLETEKSGKRKKRR